MVGQEGVDGALFDRLSTKAVESGKPRSDLDLARMPNSRSPPGQRERAHLSLAMNHRHGAPHGASDCRKGADRFWYGWSMVTSTGGGRMQLLVTLVTLSSSVAEAVAHNAPPGRGTQKGHSPGEDGLPRRWRGHGHQKLTELLRLVCSHYGRDDGGSTRLRPRATT